MKIALLGDIALIGKYDLSKNPEAKEGLKKMSQYLKKFDYVVGNLESPLTDKQKSLVCKSMHLKSPTINVELLKYLNISAVSLANNHTYDFGNSAVRDTIKTLEDNGIDYFGVNGKGILLDRVSINGYCCYSTNAVGYNKGKNLKGIDTLDYHRVVNQVKSDKDKGLLSLLALHWGDEHTNYPRIEHLNFAKHLMNINDVVINGHHPHVIQGIESEGKSLVAFSQGNFCFDDCKSITGTKMELKQTDENRESFILELNIDSNKVSNFKTVGIREINEKIVFSSVEEKLNRISEEIKNINPVKDYQNKRVKQFLNPELRLEKFGRKNFKWYLKRLNYYAIGAFLMVKLNKRKYIKYFSQYVK